MNIQDIRRLNLRTFIEDSNESRHKFCKKYNLHYGNISTMLKGTRVFSEDTARAIEEKLSLPRGYLDRDANCNESSTELTTYLPSLQEELRRKYALDAQLLEDTGCKAENLRMLRVTDLSMSPLLQVNTFVLVDVSQIEPAEGMIFVIRAKTTNEIIIRRTNKVFGTDDWVLKPDNQQFEKYMYYPETQQILGRVVYKLGKNYNNTILESNIFRRSLC